MKVSLLRYKILMTASLAAAACVPSASPGQRTGGGEFELLASFEVGEPGRIELLGTTPPGGAELLITYRELAGAEPEAAEGRRFGMVYSWDPEARSFLPIRLAGAQVLSAETDGALFPNESYFHYELTTTRWDFLLRGLWPESALSIVAAPKPGPRMPILLQSLGVKFEATGEYITLDPEIENLFYANAQAMDVDGDALDEVIIAVAYYKNRALFILGSPATPWKQITLPTFTSYAAAEEFLQRHGRH